MFALVRRYSIKCCLFRVCSGKGTYFTSFKSLFSTLFFLVAVCFKILVFQHIMLQILHFALQNDPESPHFYPEPVELPMSEFVDWLQPLSELDSQPSSPVYWDSLPASPFQWDKVEHVEFVLKEEMDC